MQQEARDADVQHLAISNVTLAVQQTHLAMELSVLDHQTLMYCTGTDQILAIWNKSSPSEDDVNGHSTQHCPINRIPIIDNCPSNSTTQREHLATANGQIICS